MRWLGATNERHRLRAKGIAECDGVRSTVVERLAFRRWHATLSMLGPSIRDVKKAALVIDLGVFGSKRAADAAAELVVGSWVWETTADSPRPSSRPSEEQRTM